MPLDPFGSMTSLPFALVLSGGNALGAYQAGVYEALHEAGIVPDWVAGASVGAFNAALIAGNAHADRLDRLHRFWRPGAVAEGTSGPIDTWRRSAAAAWTLAAGRAGMFVPRAGHWSPELPSLYDTRPLADTLAELAAFDRLNAGHPRVQVTAVDVETGDELLFDTAAAAITPDQLRASGGLGPLFPPVEVDGRALVDGGVAANLPLDGVLANVPAEGLICLAVDLLPPAAPRPREVTAVAERMQDLTFASQTRRTIASWQRLFAQRIDAVPPITLIHLVYADQGDEVVGKALDFSPASVAIRWRRGRRDAAGVIDRLQSGALGTGTPGFTVHRFDGATPA
jgi:NTE family protein